MSLQVVPFKSLGVGAVSYSTSVVTIAVSVTVCDIFNVKEWPDLETGLGFVQGLCLSLYLNSSLIFLSPLSLLSNIIPYSTYPVPV